ncbi:hypothetical protein LCGC14_2037720 [marine sediment metagenome]|uniref:Uncharacterized protein n=1 Tax=marine sediment metagenome TaxID=412755 RepID=A0A0F9H689_9ZZZZ
MDKALAELLDFINGKTSPLCIGITTYTDRDDNQTKLHNAVKELEKSGKVRRHLEEGDSIVWMPID